MKDEKKEYFSNSSIKEILKLYQPLAAFSYFENLCGWDTETYMPQRGIQARSKASSMLALEIQKKFKDQKFQVSLIKANTEKNLNDYEKSVLRFLNHLNNHYTKLPAKFVADYAELKAKASTIWAEARKDESVAIFLPILEEIFKYSKKKAEYLGYTKEPYEALFADYEIGMDYAQLANYMNEIKEFLLTIDLNNLNLPKSDIFIAKKYNTSLMQEVNLKILKYLGYDPTRFRLDVSTHPFSLFLSPDDIRLTTRYPEFDFTSSFMPVIHEFGHGFFASNVDSALSQSPLWPETSYSLHESQSRFWENIIGRSKGFLVNFIDEFQEVHLGIDEHKFTTDDVWQYLNRIKPSLIRVDADEISYHWHIIIRYELERDIMNSKLAVKDIEAAWNNKYQQYLGITPPRPSLGVLQDIHWSFGSVGYFPTYSMGSATAAMFKNELEKDISIDFEKRITSDKIYELNEWFRKKIQKFAGTYSLNEVWQRMGYQKVSAKPWIKYIKNKYKIS